MSISSIVQIASRLLNGDSGRDPQGQGKSKVAPAESQAQNNRTEFGDRFTPSAQGDAANAAGATGLFQVEQLRFTAVNIQAPTGNTAAATATSPATATPSLIQTQQDLQTLNASLTSLGLNAAEIAAFDQF